MTHKYGINPLGLHAYGVSVQAQQAQPESLAGSWLRLQNMRVDFGWTQAEAAGLAGISRGHYRTLELGHADYGDRSPSNPTMATLMELARAYRIDPKELIDLVITNSSSEQ